MTLNQRKNKLELLDSRLSSLNYAQALIAWDGMTLAPKRSIEGRANALEGISSLYFEALINPQTQSLLCELKEQGHLLSDLERAKVDVLMEEYDKIAKIPASEYSAYQGLTAKSSLIWEEAREKDEYSLFEPYLEKVIAYQKKYIQYRNQGGHPYDTLLNDFEKGLNVDQADSFFIELRKQIVPLIQNIEKLEPVEFQNEPFDIHKQEEFSRWLMAEIGFDTERGVLAQSAHPFTQNLSRNDVRMTTHYQEQDLLSALFSTIHETGHAIYEQNIDPAFGLSIIATGTSMGIHESQSRLFENNFGRSRAFWDAYYPKLQSFFPNQLSRISQEGFYKAINNVQPSLIRIEADEVTYPLHIMVRYEMEKMIFEGKAKTSELPEIWRSKYKEYLGIMPKNDSEGILQDVHWSEGLFGYFPSYALGSAYAAQMHHAMDKQIDTQKCLREGDFVPINNWLALNIHRFGRTKSPGEILKYATGMDFDSSWYIRYLTDKCAKPF